MNIVRLTTRIYPDLSGPAVYAFMLSKYVSGQDFRIFNISSMFDPFHKKEKKINRYFNIYYLSTLVPTEDDSLSKKVKFISTFIIFSFKKILQLHRKHRIDLIHCDNPSITGVVALIFNYLFKIPFIYTQHGLDSPYKLDYLLELRPINSRSIYHIIITRNMLAYFEKNNADTRKMIWIPNGIEMSKFFHVRNYNEKSRIIKELELSKVIEVNDFIIVYIGQMVIEQKVKGMIDFLHGLNLFLGALTENEKKIVKLLFLGKGLYSNLLESEIRELRLENNVFLLGERKKVENFYAISDISALTSHVEGFPTVVLESIASGVPCIATDVGEIRQLLDKNLLVPVGNREKIAELLKRLFIDKKLREELVKNSLELVKRFDWKNIAKIIKNVYLNVKNEKAFPRAL